MCDSLLRVDLWLIGDPLSDSSNCNLAKGSGEAATL
jgi:hypothetical protein